MRVHACTCVCLSLCVLCTRMCVCVCVCVCVCICVYIMAVWVICGTQVPILMCLYDITNCHQMYLYLLPVLKLATQIYIYNNKLVYVARNELTLE